MKEILQTKVINLSNHSKIRELCWLTILSYLHRSFITLYIAFRLGAIDVFEQEPSHEQLGGPPS
jgi:hypothetical protein